MTPDEREATAKSDLAKKIVTILQTHGFTAYFAGGAVRDMLLGHIPDDIDIATSAKPDEIEKIFPKNIPTGKQFGVLRVKSGKYYFEVATFRIEGPYLDGRRPSSVSFTSAEKDAKRRDFTINGLLYDPTTKKVIDYVAGQDDLKHRILRFIGDPHERIREDHLRLIRAIRFKNCFHLTYDPSTWEAIKTHAALIEKVSVERIHDELNKILSHPSRSHALQDLLDSGLLKYVLPEVAVTVGVKQPPEFHAEGDVFTHIRRALDVLSDGAPLIVVWTTLLHDVGKPDTLKTPQKDHTDRIRFDHHADVGAAIAHDVLKRLRFPRKFIDEVVWMVKNHMRVWQLPGMRLAKQRALLMDSRFPHLLEVYKADSLGKRPGNWSDYEVIKRMYREEKERPEHEKIREIVSGHDIMKALRIEPGPQIAQLKQIAQDAYLEGRVKTKKEALEILKKQTSRG
jgi:tRNA nucleotidyltransferase/poly(A) polymerase